MTIRKIDLNKIAKHVSTKYGDLTGVIQIDCHDNITSIYRLCRDHDFDVEDKFIVGFGFGETTISGIGQRGKTLCYILFVDKSQYGQTFDEIRKRISMDDSITLKQKSFFVEYSKLQKYIKRYHFVAATSLIENINDIKIENIAE